MRYYVFLLIGVIYRNMLKPILFLFDPERIHQQMVSVGQLLGASGLIRRTLRMFFGAPDTILKQTIDQIDFSSPLGLSAGFDYEARLTQVLPTIGFGLGTVGTLTNMPYEGNTRPRLGRLPKSRSLMVNKGFKNLGVEATLRRLKGKTFQYPVGVSIGKTNVNTITTQEEGIEDICKAFRSAESSGVAFQYYELNISCPNLKAGVEFYEPKHLEELLQAVSTLGLSRPVWIKMPISHRDEDVLSMLEVIARYSYVTAVIFGNLQRDRNAPGLDPKEVARFPKGNFSGVPCRERSDELIALAYKHVGTKLRIIGCGGVMGSEDVYRKMALGASLVQMITGMIFEGPQVVAQMNIELAKRLKKEGKTSISEIVGTVDKRG